MRRRSSRVRLAALVLVGTAAVAGAPTSGAGEWPTKKPPVRLVVTFDRGTSEATRDGVADSAGKVVREIDQIRTRVVEVPANRAVAVQRRLRSNDAVAFVEPDQVRAADVAPNDPAFVQGFQPSLDRVDLPGAWEYTTGAASIVIAVIDTGVTTSLPDLPSSKLVPGRNIITSSSNTGDDQGHGTASASVAAMIGHNGQRAAGACWSCSIMPIKALASNGFGLATDVAAGIVWAVDHGARVVNLSLSGNQSTPEKNAILYAESHGVVVVASAGNNTSSDPAYPAGHPSVLGVAASSTANDDPAPYTNRGEWVKVAAPGTNAALDRSGGLLNFAGTSSSAPLVSGIVGLLLSESSGLTPSQVRSALMSSAADVPYVSSAGGRVNAAAALQAIGAGLTPPPAPRIDPDPGSGSGPPTPTDLTGGGFTSSGVVTRTLSARQGAFRFEGRCSWCIGMTLEILDFNGNVVPGLSLSGDQRFTLQGTIPYDGTFFFRVRALHWGVVNYFITYPQ